MSLATELAKDPQKIVDQNRSKSSRFKKGDGRAAECGRKGGSRPHPTGPKEGTEKKVYKFKGYLIKWDRKKNLWTGTSGKVVLFGRGFRDVKKAINEYKQEYQDYIEIQPER